MQLTLGNLFLATLSAFATGIYGISIRHPNYGTLASAAALNSGITAATFFGLREYAISPLLASTLPWLQYVRRRHELAVDPSSLTPAPLSWSEKRTQKLLDSGLSGAATGAILRGWKSGPAAMLPGAITTSTICILLQYAFNEAGIARLKYLAEQQCTPDESASLMERAMGSFGLRRISDEEYLETMIKQRAAHLKRIQVLERDVIDRRDVDRDTPLTK
ncbi:hypothetical protein AMATHDRAFT_46899 [Amanita thiersii Skay4041]|uniref:Uncharacterized protein n=1 Tax=Amanita thiersii Skay4041 TaxID=703135 RepID=A0A2A9NVI5_9AGAR|nr:hypothetical protein AMATHDRAFT_46899 [Amanita thiersii Skay4041]